MNRAELETYYSYLLRNINRFNNITNDLDSSYPPKKDANLGGARQALKEAKGLIDLAIRDYEIVAELVKGELGL